MENISISEIDMSKWSIRQKKENILKLTQQYNQPLQRAILLSGATRQEAAALLADEDFLYEVDKARANYWYTLDWKLHSSIDDNVAKGNTLELRFLLQQLLKNQKQGQDTQDSTIPLPVVE